MTAANFAACFAETELFEGFRVYSNNPRDPGGATFSGTTQRVYDAWRKKRGLPLRTVRLATDDEIRTIAKLQYWDAVRGDELPIGVDLVMFDEAFNSGPVSAIKFLQAALGVTRDGQFGLGTMGALDEVTDHAKLINTLCAERIGFWKGLSIWRYFGVGWARRGNAIKAKALAMAA